MRKPNKIHCAVMLALLAQPVMAGGPGASTKDSAPVPNAKEESVFDKIWDLAKIYKDKNNPVIQELAFQGRLQLQYAYGTSSEGDYGSKDRPDDVRWGDIEVRRWRLGLKSKLFHQLKLEGQIDVQPNWDPFYDQIYDLYLVWEPSKQFNLGVGKRKVNFLGIEQNISSKEIPALERGLLSNLLFTGEQTGVWTNGKVGSVLYALGVYGGSPDKEFEQFDAGVISQASLGFDYAKAVEADKAVIRFDYQFSNDEGNTGAGKSYEHAFSLNNTYAQGDLTLYTDLLAGIGRDNVGDVWGVILMPTYDLTEKLQFVLRYQYAHGDNDALKLQKRYESLAPDLSDKGAGKQYNAVYAGVNYFIYGHKLKLMAGVEYHNMDGGSDGGGFDGWTASAALRMYF